MTLPLLNPARFAALLLIAHGASTPACAETILFVGNSFTVGALSPVEKYRPETVTDLNHEGTGGVPALFKAFADQAGLHYDVSLEAAGGTNLDFHYAQKAPLLARPWDHVILQPYSTLDEAAPGDAAKVIEYSARLAQLLQVLNPRVDVRLVATWSRADQTYLPTGHWFSDPIERMALDVRAACDTAVARAPQIRAVVPVGQAWNRAIDGVIAVRNPLLPVPANQLDLWAPDNYHASSYGYYLEALVIFGSVTGKDPRALGEKELAASELGIAPATALALQRIAFETLAAEAPGAAAPGMSATDADAAVHPQLWPEARSRGLIDAPTEARIGEILARMSLEEKVGQVIQTDIGVIAPADLRRYPLGSILAGASSGPGGDDRAPAKAWVALTREFHAVALQARAGHEPIPLLFGIDAVHGHNNIPGAVLYPHNIGLGAAHEAELVRRIGAATAEEVAATGIDWTFAPTLAVPQDVRWGRSYEGYSQDPALVREYARAAVEGLQGPADLAGKLQAGRVAATAKHFLGDGGTTDGIDQGDTRVTEQELIRLHAQGYVSAIDAGVLTVMASYSSWQGRKMHGNHSLLTDVLKGRMGFAGFVVGDWNGHSQVPGCENSHCPAAFNAGVDMFMAPDDWKDLYDNTLNDVRTGTIPAARLDDAVRRILRVKFRLGLFEAARPYEGRMELLHSAAHRELAREAVRKSLVLLKNRGVLPIRASARVLVAGPGAESISMQCGGWSISWQGSDTTNADFPGAQSVKAAVGQALAAGGGRLVNGSDLQGADRPDVAIIVYGELGYAEMMGDIQLPIYNSGQSLRQLRELQGEGIPTVSVFLSGRPLWVRPEIEASDAFVAAWLPGTEAEGIADVLIGDAAGKSRYDFTGRLSFLWPNGPEVSARETGGGHSDTWPLGFGLGYAPRP